MLRVGTNHLNRKNAIECVFDAEPKAIAEQGFQFLLLDTYSQLWLLLQQYIANAQQKAGGQQQCPAPAVHV